MYSPSRMTVTRSEIALSSSILVRDVDDADALGLELADDPNSSSTSASFRAAVGSSMIRTLA